MSIDRLQRALAHRREIEIPDDGVPEGWASARLGDGLVADVQAGFACGTNNRSGRGVGHLRPMNITTDGEIGLSDLKYVPTSEADRECRLLCEGDVLFNNTNSPELVGKTAYYGITQRQAFSNHMTRVRCVSEALDPRYCAASLHQLWRDGYFQRVCNNHVSQSSVSRAVLFDTHIPLPPLPEQTRIVARLEEVRARIDTSREHLARVPTILKRLRQSILAAACSGRLTEDWRRVKGQPDAVAATELPEAWQSIELGRIAEVIDPNPFHRYPSYENGGVPILATQQFRGLDDWDISRAKLANRSFHKERQQAHGFRRDDIVFARKGRLGLARRPPRLSEYVFSHTVFIVRTPLGVSSDYLLWFLRQDSCVSWLTNEMNSNTGVPTLGKSYMEKLPIALPPADEQTEIARRVEILFKLADAIEKRVASATARVEKLTQSILAKAFRGELVPTEAELARRENRDYEPASVLLDRIRREREADEKPQSRRNRQSRFSHRRSRTVSAS